VTLRPRVIDVAVLCLVGFFGLILTLGAIVGAAERDPAAFFWALGALGVVALTVVIWRNGRGAPLARVLGLGVVIAALVVSGSLVIGTLVGVMLVVDLVSHGRQPSA
jgi:hypothetical protein